MGIILKFWKPIYGVLVFYASIALFIISLYLVASNYIGDLFSRFPKWLDSINIFKYFPGIANVCLDSGDEEACKKERDSSLKYVITMLVCAVICFVCSYPVSAYDALVIAIYVFGTPAAAKPFMLFADF